MTYKCVFSDIDGTLLNSKNEINVRTKNKIIDLNKKGIPFILVSARMLKGMDFIQRELGIKAPMICYSGALVYDENQNIIYSKSFSLEKAESIHELIKNKFNIPISIYSENHWFVDTMNKDIQEETNITGIKPEILDYSKIKEVHKILYIASPETINKIEALLKALYPGLNIYKSKPTYLEIMDAGVLKSEAITFLCDQMNIDLKDTISFGDNFNDIEMLNLTGKGFAMGNAPEGVLKSVKCHTKKNDEDGIVYALENLL